MSDVYIWLVSLARTKTVAHAVAAKNQGDPVNKAACGAVVRPGLMASIQSRDKRCARCERRVPR